MVVFQKGGYMTVENWLTIISLIGGAIGFLYTLIHNFRKEVYIEIDKLEKKTDRRDTEIKELIKEMKTELREDMKDIRDDIRRAESFKCAGQKNE